MLPEIAGSVMYYTSPLFASQPGVKHAFPCLSGDRDESLDCLAGRMTESFGLDSLLLVKQVHGTDTLVYDGDGFGAERFRNQAFDAIITSTPGVALGVRTADCVPVLFAAPGKAVAAAHGGWRGIVGGILELTVDAMTKSYGADPSAMFAAIGPHILATCYEVGPEVAEQFVGRFGNTVLKPGKKERPHLDLDLAARLSLQNAGLKPENIDSVKQCTHCSPQYFHSYRRDGRPTGRQISLIMLNDD